jgi:hypothetical protein
MTEKLWQPYGLYELRQEDQEDVDWGKLEAAGGVTLSDELRGRLLLAINNCRERIKGQIAGVRPGTIRPILEELVRVLEKAETALSLDGRSGDEWRARMVAFRELQKVAARKHYAYAGTSKRDEFRVEILRWDDYAREAINSLPRDIGTEGNSYIIDGLLLSAHSIYVAAGGKGIYTVPAKSFRACAAEAAGYRPASDESLNDRFHKAWSKVRKNPPT